uniref:non-specific serine/threonine protein kinase n=2 Tax=Hordeum vulgare subsp. vulgare TaxID=112509 RepID=A0A8I6X1R2_HORVV
MAQRGSLGETEAHLSCGSDVKMHDGTEKGTVLMNRYELGRILGHGTFAKVYHARSLMCNHSVAIKVIDKEKVLRVGMIERIKREISVMRLVRHPNIVQLHEVMASKTKIYFVMEHVRGGDLFSRVAKGRLREEVARKFFQQLIAAIDFCHSRGVYHRDLKLENLLIDDTDNIKVSDFGLSALRESLGPDDLLHTTCGTPSYVAPEIINNKGYDGATADVWSCGVILFVLLAGYLPFHDSNLMEMYRKIGKSEFKSPHWFSYDVSKILGKLLDPNPETRITIEKLVEDPWFKAEYRPAVLLAQPHGSKSLKSVQYKPTIPLAQRHGSKSMKGVYVTISTEHKVNKCEQPEQSSNAMKPSSLNAFDIISLSHGFDISGLLEMQRKQKVPELFITQDPTSTIVSKLEEIAKTKHFNVKKKDGIVKLQGCKEGRKGKLAIDAEIFEVASSCYAVKVKKAAGDTLEYQMFCNKDLRPSLKDICWTSTSEDQLLTSCGT